MDYRWSRWVVTCLALTLVGCEGEALVPDWDAGPVDGSVSAVDGSATVDGVPGGGSGADAGQTQGAGQFCEVLQTGGPYCISGLVCCSDHICQAPGDCSGSGFLPCVTGSDCTSGRVCCDTPDMRFCTKRSACDDYGGEVIP